MSPPPLECVAGTASSSSPPAASLPPTPRRGRLERWALALGLALSALVHLLVLVIWPSFIGPGSSASRVSPEAVTAPEGMRVVAIAPIPDEASPVEEPLERRDPEQEPTPPEPERHELPEPPRPGGEPAMDLDADAVSAADRLAPRFRDPRLWAVPDELTTPGRSDMERARERVYGRIEEINDSIGAAREASLWALDWTFTDDGGKRWGIAPDGTLHLGGLLGHRRPSVEFAGNAGTAERLREWNAMRAQSDLARVRDLLGERARAIRERKDRERAKKAGGSS